MSKTLVVRKSTWARKNPLALLPRGSGHLGCLLGDEEITPNFPRTIKSHNPPRGIDMNQRGLVIAGANSSNAERSMAT